MKKTLFWIVGLIGLTVVSSCEDKISMSEDNNFLPIGYTAKDSVTLRICGIADLIFDEITKDDWKIITSGEQVFVGEEPLKVDESVIYVNHNKIYLLENNYDAELPITFANTKVTYEYVGNNLELEPLDSLRLFVKVITTKKSEPESQHFFQVGYINYTLTVGYIPVRTHQQNFIVISEKFKDNIDDLREKDEGDDDSEGDGDSEGDDDSEGGEDGNGEGDNTDGENGNDNES